MAEPGADVDWAAFPWPEPGDDNPAQIRSALRAVVEPHRKDWADPATMVRFAVGNDHRGTVYPAAVAMTGQLLMIIENHRRGPRWWALAVLESWFGGYEPETGFESYADASGARIAVIPELERRIRAADGMLTRVAADESDPDSAALARALLAVFPLGWGHTLGDDGRPESRGMRVHPDGTVDFPDR